MPDLSQSLVIGIASSALFDLSESDAVFVHEGQAAYESYQESHLNDALNPGTAFPFIQRLLDLNDLRNGLVEVVIMSRNSPKSGLRVMESVKTHALPITRALFRTGQSPFEFMPEFNMSLFLSANKNDVVQAVKAGHAAGHVLPSTSISSGDEHGLRVAFDFDGVLADDASEKVYQDGTLEEYFEYEGEHASDPLNPGPLMDLLAGLNKIQEIEEERARKHSDYVPRLRISLVTARNAPAHERAIRSLEHWGLRVDDAFFLGGLDKTPILNRLRPHIFFDDQEKNLSSPALDAPAVHIPFGLHNLVDADNRASDE